MSDWTESYKKMVNGESGIMLLGYERSYQKISKETIDKIADTSLNNKTGRQWFINRVVGIRLK